MQFLLEVLSIPLAYAQLPLPSKVEEISSGASIVLFICETVFSWLFTAAILFSIAFVLVAAYRYLVGGSNPDQIKIASKTLMLAAIGVAVAILARTLPILVGSFFAGEISLEPCGEQTRIDPDDPPGN